MSKKRVLFVSHGHPGLVVGGAEIFAYELYQGLREAGRFELLFLARALSSVPGAQPAGPLRAVSKDAQDEILWSPGKLDDLLSTLRDRRQYTEHLAALLEHFDPDLVHIQHSSGLGFELIQALRRWAPRAPIVYTLHEFLPICHAHGHLLRTFNDELCTRATPLRCHECFPDHPEQHFLVRERFVKAQLAHVDQFLAPSQQLIERYVDWGLPRERLLFEEYGRRRPDSIADDPPNDHTFGFFGQLAQEKGVLILLEAMELLDRQGSKARLLVNGANLEKQPAPFRDRVEELVETLPNVTYRGRYDSNSLRARMSECAWVVVPSIWYENSPLVIQEAFLHRRPVICSGIGGMAEKVREGVDGLHFAVGDPAALAGVLETACGSPDLRRRLIEGLEPVHSLEQSVRFHAELYAELIASRRRSA